MSLVQRLLRRYAAREASDVGPFIVGRRVLDLGAGEGWVTAALGRGGVFVCGADVGAFARADVPYAVYDGERLPFRDAAFDTTLVLLTLHHCAKPEAVLDEALRVTRARLIVTESVYRNRVDRFWLDVLDGRVNRLRHGGRMPTPLAFRRPEAWQVLFESRGLGVVAVAWVGGRLERLIHHPVLYALDSQPARGPLTTPGRCGEVGTLGGEGLMTDGARISVVIPALDEEAAIGGVVREVPRDLVREVIVVDNGSTDRTAEVAAAAGARVVREPRRGYGAACLAGAGAAPDADILVFLDGDRNEDPGEVARVLAPVLEGGADLVLGSRLTGGADPGALTPQQRVGNRVVTALLRLLYGLRLTDIGPFRAIRARVFWDLGMEHPTYGWPVEMVVKAARRGYRIVEVPVSCRPRLGRSKVGGTFRGSVLAGYHLLLTTLRYAWRRQP